MKNKIKILTIALSIFINTSAYSQLLVTNPFTGTFTWGTNGNVTNFTYNGSSIPDITVSNFTKVNVISSSSSGNFRASTWSTNSIADLNKYFEFSIASTPGTTLNMSNITFGVGRSSTGPLKWEWRSSFDNYASVITNYSLLNTNITLTNGTLSTPDLNSSWLNNVINLSDITGVENITLRFYGFGAKTNSGTGGFQGNFTFAGESVAVIPEPSTIGLLFLSSIGLIAYRIRSRISQ